MSVVSEKITESASLPIGIHDAIPENFYHSITDSVSNSMLTQIMRSPQHLIERLNNPIQSTPEMILGTAIHSSVLQSKLFRSMYACAPKVDLRKNVDKELWAEFQAANKGKICLKKEDYLTVERIVESVYSNAKASSLLTGGRPEVTLIWEDPIEKIKCRGRLDYLRNDGVILDIKSTKDASPGAFTRSIFNLGYHRQSCYYSDGYGILSGSKAESYICIAVEKEPPYAIAFYVLDDLAIEAGRVSYRNALTTYANCLKTNNWPGYPSEIITVVAPRWVSNE